MLKMNRTKSMARGGMASSVIAITTMLIGTPALAQNALQAENSPLQDIVVTARRVEERLQDVPLTVSALGTQSLQNAQVRQILDIGAQVPAVNMGKTSSPGAGNISIRGVTSQSLPRIGLDNRVGAYLDGVYLARSQGQSFSLADIERIEVLKGPQGTLFGRNVTAGSINIITAGPSGKLGAILEAGFGSRSRQRYRATINLPSWNGLSLRATYLHDSINGEIKNLAAGTRYGPVKVLVPAATTGGAPFELNFNPMPAASSFGLLNSDSAFVAARYDAIDDLTVDYKFDYTNMQQATANQGIQGWSPALGNGCVAAAIAFGGSVNQCGVGTIAFNGGVISTPGQVQLVGGTDGNVVSSGAQNFVAGNVRPDATYDPFTAPGKVKTWGHNLTVNWAPSDAASVRSITAWRRLRTLLQTGIDGGGFTLNNNYLTATNPTLYPTSTHPAGGVTPFPLGAAYQGQRQSQFSQEFQLFGDLSDKLGYLVGLYYFKEKGFAFQTTVNTNVATPGGLRDAVNGPMAASFGIPGAAVRGIPPWAPNGGQNLWTIGALYAGDYTNVTSSSQAIFGRLTFKPVEDVDIVVGGRYTKDKKTGRIPSFIAGFLDFDPLTPAPAIELTPALLRQKFDKFTYDATLSYHVTPDINVYGRYATAYLAGGALRNVPFRPESTKAAEVGLKSELLDRHLRVNAALFWQKSRDTQLTFVKSIPVTLPGVGATTTTATQVQNFGFFVTKGIEAEVTLIPVQGLTLSGSFSYSDLTYDNSDPRLSPITNPLAPETTIQASAQYDTPPIWGDAYLTFRVDGNYRSKYVTNATAFPSTGFLPKELLAAYGLPVASPAEVASSIATYSRWLNDWTQDGGFWLANARVSLVDIGIGASKARITGFVRNIFDEKRGKVVTANYGVSAGSTFVEARTFGIDFAVEF